MKILVIGDEKRYRGFGPAWDEDAFQCTFCPRGSSNAELIAACPDAEVIFADAISPVDAELIAALPALKMIHSEGVAFDKIDCKAAADAGVFVCNNKGGNAPSVAEQTVLLMLELLRDSIAGHHATQAGEQIRFKESKMRDGIHELSGMTVGLVGFGDIAKATAKLLSAFGSKVYYWNRTRREAAEVEYGVEYLPLDELCAECDIISLHLSVTPETAGLVDAAFLAKMKPTAYLVNTARGDLVDNEALRDALVNGRIAGAAFDTIAPEPTPADHPLVALPENCLCGSQPETFRRFCGRSSGNCPGSHTPGLTRSARPDSPCSEASGRLPASGWTA